MRLTDLLNLSNVPRWSIVPRLREQSVADHTFRVAVIAWELAERLGQDLTVGDFRCILCHDAEESWTGDIPGLTKHSSVSLLEGAYAVRDRLDWTAPRDRNTVIIKAADIIECLTFANAWVAQPRRGFVVDENIKALRAHCDRFKLDYAKVWEVVRMIREDSGRCAIPDWMGKA